MESMGAGGNEKGDQGSDKVSPGACRIIGCESERRNDKGNFCRFHYKNPPIYPEEALKFIKDGREYAFIRNHPSRCKTKNSLSWARYHVYQNQDKYRFCEICKDEINYAADYRRGYNTRNVDGKMIVICRSCNCVYNRSLQTSEVVKLKKKTDDMLNAMRLWSKANAR